MRLTVVVGGLTGRTSDEYSGKCEMHQGRQYSVVRGDDRAVERISAASLHGVRLSAGTTSDGRGFRPPANVEVLDYPRRSKLAMLFRYAPALDELVEMRAIDLVLTVFGPAYWRPRVPHVCGFALSQYIYENSPFFKLQSSWERWKLALKRWVHMRSFRRDADAYITEHDPISAALRELIPGKPVYTVPNSCNPVFDQRDGGRCIRCRLSTA